MPKISVLPLATSVTGDDLSVVVQGGVTKKASIDTFPISDLVQAALDAKQPLDADLTAYANAADAAVRRALISAETAGAAATVEGKANVAQSTGLIDGGFLSIGTPNTTFSISDGRGVVTDSTVYPPVVTSVTWTGKTNIAATYLNSHLISFVGIDSSGNVVQSSSPFTNAQHRSIIVLGSIIHVNQTNLDAINQFGEIVLNPTNQLSDLTTSLGKFNVSGNVFSANGANLLLNKSLGYVYAEGSNWANSKINPNVTTLASLSGLTFQYRFQNGANGATGTAVDPNIYDLAGVSTSVPTNKFTIQRVFSFVSNNVKIQPGQHLYNSLAEAKAAIQTESFTVEPSIEANGVLRAFLIVQQGTTNLQTATKAFFYEAGKFGSQIGVGGQSVSSLQNAYDNAVSPEILTSATNGAVSIKRGSAADSDDVLEVLNGAGSQVFSVKGTGAIAGLNFSGTSSGTNTGDQTITLTGDVTGSGTGSFAATIANDAVSNAKLANVATQTFKGRNTAATGDPEDLSVATVKTMLAISNVDNTSDANKPVSTATQTALNLKADLASPALTGNPTAPTPAVTDDDTSIATTAFVQDVQQAMWTQPTAIAITAAGNSNVAAVSAQNRYLTQRINVTAFTGTATVTLQSTSALAGDKRRLIVSMPAGLSNNIELRNLTSGGTLLATVPMDGALARTWLGYSTFDGTNWGTVSFSPLSVDEFVLARTAFRGDYLQSDGATTNRAQIYGPFDAVNNPREWIAGAASLTIAAVVTLPASISATTWLCSIGNSSTSPNSTDHRIEVYINTGGFLQLEQVGISANRRNFTSFSISFLGKTTFLKITFTQGSTNPVITANGVDISASFSTGGGGTQPNWLDAAMVPTYRLVGYNWPSGPAPIVTPILGETSAADDAFYLSTGRWPAWVVAGGSCADVKPVSGVFAYWFGTGSVVSSTAVQVVAAAGASGLSVRNPNLTVTPTVGSRYRFNVTVSGLSGGTAVMQLSNFSVSAAATAIASDGTYDVEVSTTIAGLNEVVIQITSSTEATVTINKVNALGALSLPSIQPINVVDDVSGIGGNQGRLLGMTPVTDKTDWRISANTWTSGNQQILAGSVLDSTKDVIDLVEQSTTGTPTTTIGSASAGSQYKASSALTAGINPVTLVTRKAASNDVWVNSNSTAVVRTTIKGHRTA